MLAIVIPYYKITFFEETIKSLANQTDKRFKVYIGDDASPENPSELVNKYQGKIDFSYHRFDSNLGALSLVQQWYRCISLVQDEEWLLVLGDDDVFQDNFVATFYENQNEIDNLGINVIRYATMVINEKGEEISKLHTHPKLETSIAFLMRKLKGGTRSSLSEFIFRKKEFDKVKFKDLPLAWYSDVLAFMEVSGFGFIFSINEAVVSFRLSGLNITSKGDNLTKKNIATFEFYHYLLNEKKEFFDLEELNILMTKIEKTFLDNKKNLFFWKLFVKLYFKNNQFKRLFLFLNLYLHSIFKSYK